MACPRNCAPYRTGHRAINPDGVEVTTRRMGVDRLCKSDFIRILGGVFLRDDRKVIQKDVKAFSTPITVRSFWFSSFHPGYEVRDFSITSRSRDLETPKSRLVKGRRCTQTDSRRFW